MSARRVLTTIAPLLVGLFPLAAQAANGDIALFSLNDTEGGQEFSVKLQILIIMTLLGFLPAMLMMMTSFTRFVIVLAILRQALGLQQSPPNNVLIGIALIMTLLVMRPVWQDLHDNAYVPFQNDAITLQEALGEARDSLGRFRLARATEHPLRAIVALAGEHLREQPDAVGFSILLPAFLLIDLKPAFQPGCMILTPLLVLALVVA